MFISRLSLHRWVAQIQVQTITVPELPHDDILMVSVVKSDSVAYKVHAKRSIYKWLLHLYSETPTKKKD